MDREQIGCLLDRFAAVENAKASVQLTMRRKNMKPGGVNTFPPDVSHKGTEAIGRLPRPRPGSFPAKSCLWLLVGAGLLPFTMVQSVIPLAAWVAPVFLLRFARTTRRSGLALLGVFAAYELAAAIAARGSAATTLEILVVSVMIYQVSRAVGSTLAYAADRYVGARLSAWPRMFVFPAAYTAVDWLLSLAQAPNTTGSIAYSQFSSLAFLQFVSVTGMWGVTFLVTWFASVVNMLLESQSEWPRVVRQGGVYAGALAAVLLFGYTRLDMTPASTSSVRVAAITLDPAVQESSEAGIDWLALGTASDTQRQFVARQLNPIMNQLVQRTEIALQSGAKIVVWAEGSGTILEENRAQTLEQVQRLAKEYGAFIEPSLAIANRTHSQKWLLNEAVLIDPNGENVWTYEKTYPTQPVETYYTVAGNGVLPTTATPYGMVSTAICNDFHFPPLIRQAGSHRVDLFLLPVNEVHPFEQEDEVGAAFRAVENGFTLIRPADVGFSSIVDPFGRLLARQDSRTTGSGILITDVPVAGVRTIYSRIGDVFAYLCAAAVVGLTGVAYFKRSRPVATSNLVAS